MGLAIWATRKAPNQDIILDLIYNEDLQRKVAQLLNGCVFEMNITSNLSIMASKAGFRDQLWDLKDVTTCGDLLPYIEKGLKELEDNPETYKEYSTPSGWGTYEQFIDWLKILVDNLKIDKGAILVTHC